MQTKTLEATETPVVDLILEAYNQADVGKYAEALAKIKAAKSLDPRNIYVIALEKQFAKLLSLPPGSAADEAKEKLPGLLDRALDSARTHGAGAGGNGSSTSAASMPDEKEARLKEVRDQYFSRADEFMERGDYESALAEVKRVSIIDPENRIAREYEEKISQLAGLSAGGEKPRAKAPGEKAKSTVPTPAPSPRESSRPDTEPAPVPLAHPVGQRQDSFPAADDQPKQKSKMPMIAAIAAVVLLGLGGAFFLTRSSKEGGARLVYSLGDAQKTVQPSQQQTVVNPTPEVTAAPPESQPADKGASEPTPSSPARSSSKEEKHSTSSTSSASAQKTESSSKPSATQSAQSSAPASPPPAKESAPAQTPAQTPAQPFQAVEKEPKIVKLVQPKLPDAVIRAGLTGRVVVKVQIDTQGKPTQAVVLTSTNHVFDDAVVAAAMSSKFEPGMMSSGPVTTWMSIPYVFK